MKHFIVISLILFSVSSVWAGDGKNPEGAMPVEITCLGVFNDQPTYSISKVSASGQPILFVVKDEFGELLYEQLLSESMTSIQLQFDVMDLGNTGIVFEVYSRNGILQFSSKIIPGTL